ncbi:MAG: LexA family transcriptional regulator [Hyphomicrobiaceae bacterium]|nr:LexA family transcriptional regulator [Hyphomicrobiaceae bacterium]
MNLSRPTAEHSLQDRIEWLVTEVGGPTNAARVAEVSRQTIDRWRSGDARLPFLEAYRLARRAGVSLDWLATGFDVVPDPSDKKQSESQQFAVVHRYEPGQGGELVEIVDSHDTLIAFREGWLRNLSMQPQNAALLLVSGDVMAPTIRDRDLILIDRAIKAIAGDGIYALLRGGALTIRRAQVMIDGSVMLIADNDRYLPERIAVDDLGQLRVVGRVRLGIGFP